MNYMKLFPHNCDCYIEYAFSIRKKKSALEKLFESQFKKRKWLQYLLSKECTAFQSEKRES